MIRFGGINSQSKEKFFLSFFFSYDFRTRDFFFEEGKKGAVRVGYRFLVCSSFEARKSLEREADGGLLSSPLAEFASRNFFFQTCATEKGLSEDV